MNPFAAAARAVLSRPLETKITTSELLPVYKSNVAQWRTWSLDTAISDGYKLSVWVFACVYQLMKAAASVPWIAERVARDGKVTPAPAHPLEQLIEHPNPFMSRQDVIERLTAHLYLGGNGLLGKTLVRGVPVELWPIDPAGVKPVPSRTEFISHYEFQKGGVVRRIEVDEVVHLSFTDPGNPYWGMSPLEAASRTVDTDTEAVRWNKIALQNRAVVDGVFTFDAPMTRDQWEEAREQIRIEHAGADNARRPWVLGSGAKFQSMSMTPAEMDFLESRKLNREEICAAFGVPPPMVGIYDQATLANIETARRIFWADTITPYLADIETGFNRAIAPAFGVDPVTGAPIVRIKADLSNVEALHEKFSDQVETAGKLHEMGVPLNTIIERLGLQIDAIEGGDVGFIASTKIPLTLAAAGTASSDDDGDRGTTGADAGDE